MKLISALLLFIFATLSLAQNTIVSYPPKGKVVHPGKNFTVELDRPVRLSFPSLRAQPHTCNRTPLLAQSMYL